MRAAATHQTLLQVRKLNLTCRALTLPRHHTLPSQLRPILHAVLASPPTELLTELKTRMPGAVRSSMTTLFTPLQSLLGIWIRKPVCVISRFSARCRRASRRKAQQSLIVLISVCRFRWIHIFSKRCAYGVHNQRNVLLFCMMCKWVGKVSAMNSKTCIFKKYKCQKHSSYTRTYRSIALNTSSGISFHALTQNEKFYSCSGDGIPAMCLCRWGDSSFSARRNPQIAAQTHADSKIQRVPRYTHARNLCWSPIGGPATTITRPAREYPWESCMHARDPTCKE